MENGGGEAVDDYESTYLYFMDSLLILTKEYLPQCNEMEYDNVAWHIKDNFLQFANILLNSSKLDFSKLQLRELGIVLTLVGSLPRNLVDAARDKEAQEISMTNPYWIPIRERAKILVSLLEEETLRVRSVLGLN